MDKMITFENVETGFTKGSSILKNISLDIKRGEFIYVTGHSGAGKTTLLRLLYGDLKPRTGILRVAGNDLSRISRREIPYLRRQIGIVFQDFKLVEYKTVYENVKMALDIFNLSKDSVREKVTSKLSKLGIKNKSNSLVKTLSAGEKQRVSIARALINKPFIILADEPTGNVDAENSVAITQLLRNASDEGATVVMATHDLVIRKMFDAREIKLGSGGVIYDSGDRL